MKKFYPNSFNYQLLKEKNLIDENKLSERFMKLENKYRKYFQNYIIKTLSLDKYDKMIIESDLKFYTCLEERKDYYQKSSPLNYIYIKNNLHIEKLEDKDLKILEESNNEYELIELIKKTWKNIIKIDILEGRKFPEDFKTQMFEGYNTKETILPNNALIIIIREGGRETALSEEEYMKNLKDKYIFIEKMIENMKKEIKEKIDYPVEIVHLLR